MNTRTLLLHGLAVAGGLALLAACGSSASEKPDATADVGPPDSKDDPASGADAANLGGSDGPPDSPPDRPVARDGVPPVPLDGPADRADAPPAGRDGATVDRDGPTQGLDGPTVDAPLEDGPNLDGRQADVWFMSLPDGRRLQVVEYCEPILSLPAEGTERCPATFDEAMAQATTRLDASIPWYAARVRQCSEGPYVYFPNGYGTACYYEPATKKLLAITIADDMQLPCSRSDTASFVYTVYGQWVICTGARTVPIVDAGAG